MRIEPARVRHDPQTGPGDPLGLLAGDGLRPAEALTVGGDAGDRDDRGPVLGDEVGEPLGARAQLGAIELVGPCRGAVDEVGDADAGLDDRGPLRVVEARGELRQPGQDAGGDERRVEAVAGMREVGARRGGPESGVDADEQQLQSRAEQRLDRRAAQGVELGACEPRNRPRVAGPARRDRRYRSQLFAFAAAFAAFLNSRTSSSDSLSWMSATDRVEPSSP
ncbi:hypothetical protein GCM10027515_20310 [Schumannella luteola]|uniref:Uncharacterized protein n=1 Tax=Schumannella luteola TaxID=472059 RepID=A0A852YEI8_9MICO|nr:hypothetical protein [Schumannella luteola]